MMPPIEYSFTGPDGIAYNGINLRAFCRAHSLDNGNAYQVLIGARRHCGGFTCPDADYIKSSNKRPRRYKHV